MRSFLVAVTGLMLFVTGAAEAKVAITVDKDSQQMTVAVDGVERYRWPVSSGLPSYETPNGSFRAFRMEAGSLLQGIRRRADAAFDLLHQAGPRHSRHRFRRPARLAGFAWLRAAVARQRLEALCAGAGARRAQHHGDADRLVPGRVGAQSAAAHNNAVARRAPAPQQYEQQTNAAGDPVVIPPQPARAAAGLAPQARAEDGYIYPADGSSSEARYPAPRDRRSTARRPIRSRSRNIMTTAAMRRRRRAITSSSLRLYQPRGLFTDQD